MKPMPPLSWTAPELALFAGMLSGSVSLPILKSLIEGARSNQGDHEYYFGLIEELRQHVSEQSWNLKLDVCRRLYSEL
jgi:hypothetical protein